MKLSPIYKNIKRQYKIAIVPKGTMLFRKAKDTNVHDDMFFGFDSGGTYSANYKEGKMQIWEVKDDIISTLIVKRKNRAGNFITDLETLYFDFCGEKKYYLNIKSGLNPNRYNFLEFLRDHGIHSWVTSVENKSSMDFFLFTDKNAELIQFKKQINNDRSELLNEDSFEKVIILDNSI